MILIEINAWQMEKLLLCRGTKKRGFNNYGFNDLLNEAIIEFYNKYGKEKK